MVFDPLYIILVLLPGILISGWASARVHSAFNKYKQVASRRGYTGAQAAQHLLDQAGLHDVNIRATRGFLSDHYHPGKRELVLSEEVYYGNSLASIGVACHEAGHALQHAEHYAPLKIRSALVPMASIGSGLGYMVMLVGLFMHPYVVLAGAILFSAVLLFQVVTLPVEFDASNRAKRLVVESGIIDADERTGIDKVLNAAAMTYVAAAITTLLTLLYFLMRSGLLGGSDD